MTETKSKAIQIFERRLKREKQARLQAEELLESKSRELYLSHEKLKQQAERDQVNHQQLSFLLGLLQNIWHAESQKEVIENFLKTSGEFLCNAIGVYFVESNGEYKTPPTIFSTRGDDDDGEALTTVAEWMERLDLGLVKGNLVDSNTHNFLLPLKELLGDETNTAYIYVIQLFESEQECHFSGFIYLNGNKLDVLKLQVFESSRNMLAIAIERKNSEQMLHSQFQELQQAYTKLDETQEKLLQSEKMASIGTIAAGIAHEINNPIGFVLSNFNSLDEYSCTLIELLSLAQRFLNAPERHKDAVLKFQKLWEEEDADFLTEDIGEILSVSKKGLLRVKDIVLGLKTFSHNGKEDYGPMDLNECLEDSLQLVWNELKYDFEVLRDFAQIPRIIGNPGQLQQVFVNLLINAKHAMESGGKIWLTTRSEERHVLVSIQDNGCGIAEDNLNKLFDPFFTSKPVGVGTGLGLSISYSIIKAHNGEIEVESELNNGTTFNISFLELLE